MAQYEMSDVKAFDALRETSQKISVKISTLAQTLIADHHRDHE